MIPAPRLRPARCVHRRTLEFALAAALINMRMSTGIADDGPTPLRLHAGDHLVYERRCLVTQDGTDRALRRVIDEIHVYCLEAREHTYSVLLDVARQTDQRAEGRCGAALTVDTCARRKLLEDLPMLAPPTLDALDVLPPPRDPLAPANEWYTPADPLGRVFHVQTVTDPTGEGRRLRLEAEDRDGILAAAGLAARGDVWLDPRDGTVLRVEFTQPFPTEGATAQTVAVLRVRRQHEQRWAIRRTAEAARYRHTQRGERRLLLELTQRPEQSQPIIERLLRARQSFATDVEAGVDSPFESLAAADRRRAAAAAESLRARARLAQRWLGRPARPWVLEDERGRPLRSEQVRRGTVVEWFWRSDRPPGLDTPRTLLAMQAGLNARSIGLVSYCLDADAVATRRLLQVRAAGLTNVVAAPLRDAEGIDELPVVRLIDDVGIVRRVWIGVAPGLDELTAPD